MEENEKLKLQNHNLNKLKIQNLALQRDLSKFTNYEENYNSKIEELEKLKIQNLSLQRDLKNQF